MDELCPTFHNPYLHSVPPLKSDPSLIRILSVAIWRFQVILCNLANYIGHSPILVGSLFLDHFLIRGRATSKSKKDSRFLYCTCNIIIFWKTFTLCPINFQHSITSYYQTLRWARQSNIAYNYCSCDFAFSSLFYILDLTCWPRCANTSPTKFATPIVARRSQSSPSLVRLLWSY